MTSDRRQPGAPTGPVALVTVTYNSATVLPDFLASVAAQTGVDLWLYVVDNASDDGTADMVSDLADERVVLIRSATNGGVAAGNNMGIKAALADGCRNVLLINNDTVFGEHLVRDLLASADRLGCSLVTPAIEAAVPQGTIWYAGGEIKPWLGFQNTHQLLGQPLSAVKPERRPVGYAPTCCLLVRAEVFEVVGMMDEAFFLYFDDTDFIHRCRQAGYEVWLDSHLRMEHKVSSLSGGATSALGLYWMSRSWVLMIRKHAGTVQKLWSFVYLALWTLALLVAGNESARAFRRRLEGYRDGLRQRRLAAGSADPLTGPSHLRRSRDTA